MSPRFTHEETELSPLAVNPKRYHALKPPEIECSLWTISQVHTRSAIERSARYSGVGHRRLSPRLESEIAASVLQFLLVQGVPHGEAVVLQTLDTG